MAQDGYIMQNGYIDIATGYISSVSSTTTDYIMHNGSTIHFPNINPDTNPILSYSDLKKHMIVYLSIQNHQ